MSSPALSPRPHPLPARGRGGATPARSRLTHDIAHLPPPSWGRDGEGGHPTAAMRGGQP